MILIVYVMLFLPLANVVTAAAEELVDTSDGSIAFSLTDDKKSADIGDVVSYSISLSIPVASDYPSFTYTIQSVLTEGLTYDPESLKVVLGDLDLINLITYKPNDLGFTIEIPVMKLQEYADEKLTLSYQAQVNEGAIANVESNTTSLTYSYDPLQPSKLKTMSDVEKVYSSLLVVDAYDSTQIWEKIEGARFALINSEGKYYYFREATDSMPAQVLWVSSVDDATIVSTDEQGAAVFPGLKNGNYVAVVESQAPDYQFTENRIDIAVVGHVSNSSDLRIVASAEGKPLSLMSYIETNGAALAVVIACVFVFLISVRVVAVLASNIEGDPAEGIYGYR